MFKMSSEEDHDRFEDTSILTSSASSISITLPPSGTTDNHKKRKIHAFTEQTPSESNIAKLKVLI